MCLLKTWKLWAFQAFRDLFNVCTLQLTWLQTPSLWDSIWSNITSTLLSKFTRLWHWSRTMSLSSHRLDKLCYTIVKVENIETPPRSSPPTMIWILTRWTLLIFHVIDHKLSFCRFCKSTDSPSPKNWKSSRRIYCQFIWGSHTSKYMQQITRSKVHLTAAFQIADSLTAPRLEFTYAYEYFLPAGRRKRSLRICFVHKR